MTQVSTVPHPGSPAALPSASAEAGIDASEDPDSPGRTALHAGICSAVQPPGDSLAPPAAPGRDSLSDPLAEPLAAVLGAGLAFLSLLVPLFTVLSDRREPETGRRDPAAPALVLRSEGIDPRSGGGRAWFR